MALKLLISWTFDHGYHDNIATMTTDSNLPLNSASIMYHFGVSLVFPSLIIRKVLP